MISPQKSTYKTLLISLFAALIFIVLVGCSSISAMFPMPPVTPTVHAPQVSNGLIAFMIRQSDETTDIYTMNPDGSNIKRLTDYPGNDSNPIWTPNGKQIFYISESTDGCLDVMDADGGNKHCIPLKINGESLEPPVSDGVYKLAWSPDGTKLAFVVYYRFNTFIYAMNIDGSDLHLIYDLSAHSFSWSPDSQQIVFSSNRSTSDHINVVDVGKHSYHEIKIGDNIEPFGLYWSRDGNRIFFANDFSRAFQSKTYSINIDGTNLRRLLPLQDAMEESIQAVSPDGSQLLIAVRGPQGNWDEVVLVLVDAYDYSVKHIFQTGVLDQVLWSPDGKQILYSNYDNKYHIVNADGTGERTVVLPFDVYPFSNVTWQPVWK